MASRVLSDIALIREVQKYPILYDNRLKGARNPNRKEMIWKEIAQIVGCDVETIKYRWRCLRERYVRVKRHQAIMMQCGSDKSQVMPKQWRLYKQMSFLADTVSHRNRMYDVPSPTEGETESEDRCDISVNNANEISFGDSYLSVGSMLPLGAAAEPIVALEVKESSGDNPEQTPQEEKEEENWQGVDDNFNDNSDAHDDLSEMDSDSDRNFRVSTFDADEHFFLSLAPLVKKITNKRKIRLQIEILQIINRYVNE